MVEYANLSAEFKDGALYIYDSGKNTVLVVTSTGFDLRGGANTISTPALTGGVTVSSGLVMDGLNTRTVTTTYTLVQADSGRVANCAVDGTFVTLPLASTTSLAGVQFTLRNSGTTAAAQVILITTTTETIIGGGVSTTNLLSNTKATADKGDYVTVSPTGSSSWRVVAMVGTWASTT